MSPNADVIGRSVSPEAVGFRGCCPEIDREALTGEFADHLAATGREGLADGVCGWFDDDIAVFRRDWGFEPTAMS